MVKIIEMSLRDKRCCFRSMEYNLPVIEKMFNHFIEDDSMIFDIDELGYRWRVEVYRDDAKIFIVVDLIYDRELLVTLDCYNPDQLLASVEQKLVEFKFIKFCDCGTQIRKSNIDYNFCEKCFVYLYYNHENCPICLSNGEGIWVKSKECNCKNYYHKTCLSHVEKCPTCRLHINSYTYY